MSTLLKLQQVETYIEEFHILQGISFEARKGEVTVLLGRNGAGKTTTLRTIMGLNKASKGQIFFGNEEIQTLQPYEIANKGMGYVPEDQGIFGELTVEENIKVAMKKDDSQSLERLEWILQIFPDLKKFWQKQSGLLSGGQKQMLSIARAYVKNCELLLIDEPSKGLAPIVVEKVMESIQEMKDKTTIILVEQNFMMASRIGDYFYIVDEGRTVYDGKMQELIGNKELREKHLGIA
ncbi:ABC transporter ATP-binding protein [Cytobacillus purgationiresistens]|uniref:Branched-chain amino acid transport system ATP-binding protein n=1 Tax=Cytobacillus purgationiresistens TaxID=863449 RepID=A0ABU0ABC9_9BACI|nr:ABC transporter ATP-binding protein [Cytobacillus purgationiresistens]MDQ0268561.1 branched-chain amino acid transport system ATP-binding protein [Cytobacillus purgationiresistens]